MTGRGALPLFTLVDSSNLILGGTCCPKRKDGLLCSSTMTECASESPPQHIKPPSFSFSQFWVGLKSLHSKYVPGEAAAGPGTTPWESRVVQTTFQSVHF